MPPPRAGCRSRRSPTSGRWSRATATRGLDVRLRTDGEVRALPSGLELAAYRIVQEALTNTMKHAGPARAEVRVAFADDALSIVVADDGRGP